MGLLHLSCPTVSRCCFVRRWLSLRCQVDHLSLLRRSSRVSLPCPIGELRGLQSAVPARPPDHRQSAAERSFLAFHPSTILPGLWGLSSELVFTAKVVVEEIPVQQPVQERIRYLDNTEQAATVEQASALEHLDSVPIFSQDEVGELHSVLSL